MFEIMAAQCEENDKLHKPAIERAFEKILSDKRVTVWHLGLFSALMYCYSRDGSEDTVSITRRELMHLAHFHSLSTYHNCMKELVRFGYIHYLPSYNPLRGSMVYFKGNNQPL